MILKLVLTVFDEEQDTCTVIQYLPINFLLIAKSRTDESPVFLKTIKVMAKKNWNLVYVTV